MGEIYFETKPYDTMGWPTTSDAKRCMTAYMDTMLYIIYTYDYIYVLVLMW